MPERRSSSVSHGLGSLRHLCDRVAWIDKGRLKNVGAAGLIIDDYIGDVHQTDDGTSGTEGWGSGEVTIEGLEILDASGKQTDRLVTGQTGTFRLAFEAQRPVPRPSFAILFRRADGLQVAKPTTSDAGVAVESIRDRGQIEFQIDRLLLLPGS